jgi:hypothetical protein
VLWTNAIGFHVKVFHTDGVFLYVLPYVHAQPALLSPNNKSVLQLYEWKLVFTMFQIPYEIPARHVNGGEKQQSEQDTELRSVVHGTASQADA